MELYQDNPIQENSVSLNSVLANTFFRMFLGLLASAISAFFVYHTGLYEKLLQGSGYLVLAIAEIVIVLLFSFLFKKLSPTAVTILYFAYAFLNGFTLSVLLLIYEISSVVYAFVATAAVFGVLAYIGKTTNKDLTKFGTFLIVALIIGLVVTIINLFVGSTILDIGLNWAILFIFFGLTIYDTNKIKRMYEEGFVENEKLYIYGAMELYLDFINIFLRILRLLGKRRS